MSASSVSNSTLPDVQRLASSAGTATLPPEIWQQIFAEAGNPRVSEVCREWRDLNFSACAQRFFDYRDSDLIRPFMPTTRPPLTVEGCANAVKETVQRIKSYFHEHFGDTRLFSTSLKSHGIASLAMAF